MEDYICKGCGHKLGTNSLTQGSCVLCGNSDHPLMAKTDGGAEVPCNVGLLLKLLEEMRAETVECLWDHANSEDLDKQTCESMTSRLEDFFNQKIYDIKRKQ